jgi:hypothetical protein
MIDDDDDDDDDSFDSMSHSLIGKSIIATTVLELTCRLAQQRNGSSGDGHWLLPRSVPFPVSSCLVLLLLLSVGTYTYLVLPGM